MKKKQSKKTITVGMHYATMTALIVSNITVFILCIIFSGMLGTGLVNVAIIGSQQKASAQALFGPVTQLKIAESDFRGYTTLVEDPMHVLDDSIIDGSIGSPSSGSSITGKFYFNVYQPDHDPTLNIGAYFVEGPFTIKIGNYHYTAKQIIVLIYNNVAGSMDAVVIRPVLVVGSSTAGSSQPLLVNGLELQLQDSNGTALEDDSLPVTIDLDNFTWSSASMYGTAIDDSEAYWFIHGPLLDMVIH